MRVLATLDYPTMGTAEICGINVISHPAEVRRLLGWMPDHFGNYEHMTVLEYLDFYARALGFAGSERRERVDEVMEFTELGSLADRFSNKLSKGMTQRLGLARALIHDPQVLVMDEPAAGLDPKARVELKHLIRVLAGEGKTIFISSHILSELGEMCDTLLFINEGRIIHHGCAEELKTGDGTGGSFYDVQVAADPQVVSDWVVLQPHVEFVEARRAGARIQLETSEPELAAQVLARMIRDGLPVIEFHKEQRNLEDAFIDIVGKLQSGAPPALPGGGGGREASPRPPAEQTPPSPTAESQPQT
jgi:ABC-2 type transport system ATP-binding protein